MCVHTALTQCVRNPPSPVLIHPRNLPVSPLSPLNAG
jgi:hypothetical protein